ncbi:TIR domain-containing protein [Candidatus Poribacteria bacterium]
MSNDFQFDVFLSHNSKDKPKVRKLAKRLKKAGLRVWFDEWNINPGDDIYLAVERGLEVSCTLILCMSPAAFGSGWVDMERSTSLFRDPTNKGRRFIPLLLADCEIPDALRRYKYVDYREEDDEALQELLVTCHPAAETPPPAKEPKPEKTTKRKKKPSQPELAALERKLTGHEGWVNSVAVSPDGKWVASGSDDKTVMIWDLETSECRATLEGHTGRAQSVAITPDGKRILSGSSDKTLGVWDAVTHNQLLTLKGHQSEIWSVVTLLNGKRVLSSSWDKTLRLWDVDSGQCLKVIDGDDDRVFCVAATKAGTRAVSGQDGGKLRYWDLETGECLATLEGHSGRVNSVQITPDGYYAVSGSEDKTIKTWDLEKETCIGTLEGHQKKVHSVAISPDGAVVASTGFTDDTVRLWDWRSGDCLQIIEHEGTGFPVSVAFSPDGQRLIVGCADPFIYVYRLTGIEAALPVEATRRYINARVVLVGESGVGKSGLAHRLMEDEFVQTHSTHGMAVWPLDLPIEQQENLEREALLWDLAGQDDYRLIHQLFLDETALALMLINPQKDDPFAEVGDWVKALHAAVAAKNPRRQVAKLLIAARVDVGGIKVSKQKIDRVLKEHDFADFLSTSALSGENCSDSENDDQPSALKQLIAQHIPWDLLPWTSTPQLLDDIKNAVMDMRDNKDIRLLRFAELYQRLEPILTNHTFSESDVRTAITLLGNHSLAMPLKFGDLVLLRPELTNGYAGAVIRAAREHIDEIGCVREEDVYGEDFDFEGVERLERPDEELLLRAMVQTFLDTSLCITEDTPEGRHLIFPSQYRRDRPIPEHPVIFVSYTFAGELQTVYTTLVVRLWYSREFENRELWRNAAEFETSKEKTLGLVMERAGDGEGTISVFFDADVPDELKVVFIEYVHQHLGKYARNVSRDRHYVCPKCGRLVTDFDAVRERLELEKDFIYCQICDEKVPLIDHIEQRLATDPVARRVLGMDEMATQQLDIQALEQILIGHMMATCGEANQIFQQVSMPDYGIDGEVEFKDKDGKPSGQKIHVQFETSGSRLRTSRTNGKKTLNIKKPHLDYWTKEKLDVYVVIRDDEEAIRWMNLIRYLKQRRNKKSRQVVFDGEKLDAPAVWRVRDELLPR